MLLAAAAPLFLLSDALALGANLLILLAAGVDAARVPPPSAVRVARTAPARLSLGEEGEVEISLESAAARPLRVRITDDLPPVLLREGEDSWEVRLPAGGSVQLRYRVRAEERGVTRLSDVHLRLLGPLGLVWMQRRVARADTVIVQPGLRALRSYRKLAHLHRLREVGLRTLRERGEGSAFESLREYVAGDDPRRIDWKATGRHGSLIVRQFEVERSQSVLLALDAGRLMTERIDGRERLDHALSGALLLADVAAQHGDRVGVFVFADRIEHFLPPTRGSLASLADVLARIQPRLVEPDYPGAFGYLGRQLRRRSLLVLFTDLIDSHTSAALLAHLTAATRRHLPLAVTLRNTSLEAAASLAPEAEDGVFRRAAAEELLQARARALAAMQRAGVLVADARPDEVVPAVVSRYLEVKRKGLL